MDMLVCVVPHYDAFKPSIASFLINGISKQNGFISKVIDFNYELFQNFFDVFGDEIDHWMNIDTFFDSENKALKYDKFVSLLDKWAERILDENPRYVAFSVLTHRNYLCVVELSRRLKEQNFKGKIVVGGVSAKWFKDYLNENNSMYLIDHICIGYGESVIEKLLMGEFKEKILISSEIDFSENFMPDYSDIDMSNYCDKQLYLSTSRGCIYHCSFCQVRYIWDRFVARPIPHVLEEMSLMKETYNINEFLLTDSIINAIMPHFRNLCNELKKYDYKWHGMFSIRNKVMIESDYELLRDSGCSLLHIGIESGSQKVRKHMGKKFINSDVFETLGMLDRYNVKNCIMFMTGYPTESDDDFEQTKRLISEIKSRNYKYVDSIRAVALSIKYAPDLKKYETNPNFLKRYDRYEELRDHIIKCGFEAKLDIRLKKWSEIRKKSLCK
jgi:radical SAM superfamily enzyme YgiQ (UPF0313 family)